LDLGEMRAKAKLERSKLSKGMLEMIDSESSAYSTDRSNSMVDRAEQELAASEIKFVDVSHARIPQHLKKQATYDPMKMFTAEMKRNQLRGDQMEKFESQLQKFKDEYTLAPEPIEVVQEDLVKMKQNPVFQHFGTIHEKKMMRNI
jgi:hypothetical protein